MQQKVKIPSNQPKENNRYICTKTFPYNKNYSNKTKWSHPDSKFIRDSYSSYGDYEYRVCEHCGLEFRITLGA